MAETINQRIRSQRKKLQYTQYQVAKMLSMKESTYSQMERKGNITCEILIKLCDILNTDALTLLYGEKEQPKESKKTEEIEKNFSTIPMLVAQNLYENFAVIAMRSLPSKKKQEIYEFVLNKLKEY